MMGSSMFVALHRYLRTVLSLQGNLDAGWAPGFDGSTAAAPLRRLCRFAIGFSGDRRARHCQRAADGPAAGPRSTLVRPLSPEGPLCLCPVHDSWWRSPRLPLSVPGSAAAAASQPSPPPPHCRSQVPARLMLNRKPTRIELKAEDKEEVGCGWMSATPGRCAGMALIFLAGTLLPPVGFAFAPAPPEGALAEFYPSFSTRRCVRSGSRRSCRQRPRQPARRPCHRCSRCASCLEVLRWGWHPAPRLPPCPCSHLLACRTPSGVHCRHGMLCAQLTWPCRRRPRSPRSRSASACSSRPLLCSTAAAGSRGSAGSLWGGSWGGSSSERPTESGCSSGGGSRAAGRHGGS